MALPSQDVFAEVGWLYLAAASTPREARVVAAYQQLQAETDRLFHSLVRSVAPHPVRIAFTRCPDPYDSDGELIAAVRRSRVLEITTAAVSSEPLHPVLGCELGGPFDRFRGVHDLIGHARTGFGFGLQDEVAAWRRQDRLHGPLARWALATELLAINCARSAIREAPDHKAMLLDPDLSRRARVQPDALSAAAIARGSSAL